MKYRYSGTSNHHFRKLLKVLKDLSEYNLIQVFLPVAHHAKDFLEQEANVFSKANSKISKKRLK